MRYIHDFHTAHHYPPVFSDLCTRFGISRSVAFAAATRLREAGLLTHQSRIVARALSVTAAGLVCLGVTVESGDAGAARM